MSEITTIENAVLDACEESQGQALTLKQPSNLAAAAGSPASMMMAMLDKGATIEQIGQMMSLQERYEAREATKRLNAAFAAFKEHAIRIIKSKQVTDGPLRGKGYAELHSVVDAVTPALSKHGLSTAWKITKDDRDWIEVTCILRHVDGATESVSLGGPPDSGGAKNAIQSRASTVSYLERYTLKAVLGVAEGGDDDDGASTGDAQTEDRRALWLQDQIANIAGARTPRDLNSIMDAALKKTRDNNDKNEEDILLFHYEEKKATAKKRTEGAQA